MGAADSGRSLDTPVNLWLVPDTILGPKQTRSVREGGVAGGVGCLPEYLAFSLYLGDLPRSFPFHGLGVLESVGLIGLHYWLSKIRNEEDPGRCFI